jgi:hypothetical protein
MRFRFFFDKENILKAANYNTVVSEINKYLLPKEEAEKVLSAEKDLKNDLGLTESEVTQRLGPPVRSVTVGDQKSLKYKDMTVILKSGKVAQVNLE